jgi:hypothetical protein
MSLAGQSPVLYSDQVRHLTKGIVIRYNDSADGNGVRCDLSVERS